MPVLSDVWLDDLVFVEDVFSGIAYLFFLFEDRLVDLVVRRLVVLDDFVREDDFVLEVFLLADFDLEDVVFPAEAIDAIAAGSDFSCEAVAFFGLDPDFEPDLFLEDDDPTFDDPAFFFPLKAVLDVWDTPELSLTSINFPVREVVIPDPGDLPPPEDCFAARDDAAFMPSTPIRFAGKFIFGACFGSRRMLGASDVLIKVVEVDGLNTLV